MVRKRARDDEMSEHSSDSDNSESDQQVNGNIRKHGGRRRGSGSKIGSHYKETTEKRRKATEDARIAAERIEMVDKAITDSDVVRLQNRDFGNVAVAVVEN